MLSLFALHPTEIRTVVKNYSTDLPLRPKALDYQIATNDTWNYALALSSARGAPAPPEFDPAPSIWDTQLVKGAGHRRSAATWSL